MKRIWSRFRRDERGNVSVLVATGMVALLGSLALVSDVGMIYVERQRMMAAYDSGALAGVQRILQGREQAVATALEYVERNGQSATEIAADPRNLVVSVQGRKSIPLAFARALGREQADIAARSVAQAGVTVAAHGFVPIGVPEQTFQYGNLYTLSQGAGNGSSGNYMFLNFPLNSGADDLGRLMMYGYDERLFVGQQILTKTGINTGKVADAIRYRIGQDGTLSSCNQFSTASSGCHRILYLPVVDSMQVEGSKPVTIVGFAAFYLEQMQGGGGHQEILGRFIRTIMPGEMGTGRDFGVYSVKLTH